MPDYQGVGLGMKFLNTIAKQYKKVGWDFCIDTSAKNLISSLNKNENWICYGYNKSNISKKGKIDKNRKLRSDCFVGRFKYVGDSI